MKSFPRAHPFLNLNPLPRQLGVFEPFTIDNFFDHPKTGKIRRSVYRLDCPLPGGNVNTWFFQALFAADDWILATPQGKLALQFRLLFDADKNFAARKTQFKPTRYFTSSGALDALQSL